ncbi:hypothetical protein Bbelb_375840 [Branchiostoma belcheri]|nr:hypothetical protein Bbelb_375840 [Branchiostoma belcheri]
MEREVDTAREIATVPSPYLTPGVWQRDAQDLGISKIGASTSEEPSQDDLACAVDESKLKTSAGKKPSATASYNEEAGRKLVSGLPSKSHPPGSSPLVVPSGIRERAETTEDGTQASPQKISAFDSEDDGVEEYMLVAGSTSPASAETQEHPGGVGGPPEAESTGAAPPAGGMGLYDTPPVAETTAGGGIGATPKPQADHPCNCKDNGMEEYMLVAGSTSAASAETQEPPDDGGIVATPEPESPDAARPAGGTGLYDTPPDAVTIAGGGVDGTPEPESPVPDGERPAGGTGSHDTPPGAETTAGGGVDEGPARGSAHVDGPDPTLAAARYVTGTSTDKTTVIGRLFRRVTSRPRPVCLVVTSVVMATLVIAVILFWMHLSSQHATVRLTPESGGQGSGKAATARTGTGSGSTGKPESTHPPWNESGSGSPSTPEVTEPDGTDSGGGSTGKPDSTKPTGTVGESGIAGTPEATDPDATESGGWSTGNLESTEPAGTGYGGGASGGPEATKEAPTVATTYKTTAAASGNEGMSNGTIVFEVPRHSSMGRPLAARGASVSPGGELFLCLPLAKRVKVYSMRGVFLHEFRTSTGHYLANGFRIIRPEDIATDKKGNVLVVGSEHGQGWVGQYSREGLGLETFGLGGGKFYNCRENSRGWGVQYILGSGKFYNCSENGHGWVVQYSREGLVLKTFGLGGGKFYNSRGIAVDRHNREVMVTGDGQSAVQVYRPDGYLLRKFGRRELKAPLRFGRRQLKAPLRFASFVCLFVSIVTEVRAWDLKASMVLRKFGHRDLKAPLRIAVGPDPRGRVFLSDPFSHEVFAFTHYGWYVGRKTWYLLSLDSSQVYSERAPGSQKVESSEAERPSEGFPGMFGGVGAADGLLNRPQGLCTGPDRTVIVADKENRRVQVFTYDGKHVRTIPTGGRPYAVAVFTYDGKHVRTVPTGGRPYAVALGPAGQLVVANDLSGSIGIYPTY